MVCPARTSHSTMVPGNGVASAQFTPFTDEVAPASAAATSSASAGRPACPRTVRRLATTLGSSPIRFKLATVVNDGL